MKSNVDIYIVIDYALMLVLSLDLGLRFYIFILGWFDELFFFFFYGLSGLWVCLVS